MDTRLQTFPPCEIDYQMTAQAAIIKVIQGIISKEDYQQTTEQLKGSLQMYARKHV